MTFADYLIDILLVAVVLLQVRGRRLTLRATLVPVAIVVWAAVEYLHGVPTAGNDLLLVVLAAGLGTLLGVLCGLFTRVSLSAGGQPFAKAGPAAAVLWVVGVGTRFAFQLYATHGGGSAINRFSVAHSITTPEAWVAALILMAMGEALARTAVLVARAQLVQRSLTTPARTTMIGAGGRAY